MVKIISMFNNKGGVSKTTTTFNLGWSLAKKGLKVLLIDADPQSNLTSLTLSLPDEDSFAALYDKKDSNDIYALASHLRSSMVVDSNSPISNIVPTSQDGLFILPGHISIEEFSTNLSLALELGNSGQFREFRNRPGSLNHAFRRIADIHRLDYIVIDMAPSLSSLNEVLLMGSDFFISPCAPDFFSEIALKNLAKIIPVWHEQTSKLLSDYPLPCHPQFLGVIQQNYRPRRSEKSDDRNKPTQSFRKWINRVRSATINTLVPELQKINLVIDQAKFLSIVTDNEPYDIAYISSFNSLIAASQMRNKPVFELDEDDIKSCANRFGASLQTAKSDVEKFLQTFDNLADKIIKLTTATPP
jgi:cellulose biosynthesis protein BcsQ